MVLSFRCANNMREINEIEGLDWMRGPRDQRSCIQKSPKILNYFSRFGCLRDWNMKIRGEDLKFFRIYIIIIYRFKI